jgi:hypothetical protein
MRKLRWTPAVEPHTLIAGVWASAFDEPEYQHYGWAVVPGAQDLDPVHTWCAEHDCGVSTSFDTFCFRNQQEVTMFLLRWA